MKMEDENVQQESSHQALPRRKFIKRGSAGLLIASIPSTAVWGQDGLLAGSIAVSGTGSTYATNSLDKQIQLGSPGKWKPSNGSHPVGIEQEYLEEIAQTFASVFGQNSSKTGTPYGDMKVKEGKNSYRYLTDAEKDQLTLDDILMNPGSGNGKCGGPGNLNFYMVEMYLNACFHGEMIGGDNIYVPVIKDRVELLGDDARGLFSSKYDFAAYLYESASEDPEGMALELQAFLTKYHV